MQYRITSSSFFVLFPSFLCVFSSTIYIMKNIVFGNLQTCKTVDM